MLARSALAPGVPDPGPTADALEKRPVSEWVDALQRWFVDLMLAAHSVPARYYPGLETLTAKVAKRASAKDVADTARWLTQQRALADHPLNSKLLADATAQRIILAISARQVQ